jgi:hypothetical protein
MPSPRPSGLTVAVGGQGIGNPPIGPLSPGFEPVYNLIMARRLNLRAVPWTSEILYHRGLPGRRPNLAPLGVTWRGSRIPTKGLRKNPHPTAPYFGATWAGVGGS